MESGPSVSPPEPSFQPSHRPSRSSISSSSSPSPSFDYGSSRSPRSKSSTRRFLLHPSHPRFSISRAPETNAVEADADDSNATLATDEGEGEGESSKGSTSRRARGKRRVRSAAAQAFGHSAQQERYDRFMAMIHPVIRHFLGWREKEGATTGRARAWLPILNRVSPEVESYLLAFFASAIAISSVLLIFSKTDFLQRSHFEADEKVVIMGSMGATIVLIYSLPFSPASQPRAVLLGHLVSSIIGCSVSRLFTLAGPSHYSLYLTSSHPDGGSIVWIAGGLATSLALVAMKATKSVHPPGGATALLSCSSKGVAKLGFLLVPIVLISALILILNGLFLINLTRLHYPTFWWTAPSSVPPAPPLPETSTPPPSHPHPQNIHSIPLRLLSHPSSRRASRSPGSRSPSRNRWRYPEAEEVNEGSDWFDEQADERDERVAGGSVELEGIKEGVEERPVRGRTISRSSTIVNT